MPTTTLKLLEDQTALADYLDQRLTCVCEDRLEALTSGAQLMQALVNLHHITATFERCMVNLAHTIVVQPELVRGPGVPTHLGAGRSVEVYTLLATGSKSGRVEPIHTSVVRQKLSGAFLSQASLTMGFAKIPIEPSDASVKQARLIEQILSPGRPMSEAEFFQALGFCLAWTNFCSVMFGSLQKFLRNKSPALVNDLEGKIVKTYYGDASAWWWIDSTIKMNGRKFAAVAKAATLIFYYYGGNTDTDILSYWLIEGIKNFDSFHEVCLSA
ncbi:MAG: hypothetical protein JST44_24435 [Cyanobacteria bacterium SZAS LIN-5]|nr:hypothetical protein [Cyanobacteria bacterium SZAS LIN-5]